jgi:hypothetical protein
MGARGGGGLTCRGKFICKPALKYHIGGACRDERD